MKSLTQYLMLEGLITEKFGSEKVREFFKNIEPKYSRIRFAVSWDKIPDSEVEICDIKTGIKRAGDENSLVVFKMQNDIVGYKYDDIVNINSGLFPKVKTLEGLVRKISGAQCLVLSDYNRWSTSELRKDRKEAQAGAIAMQDDWEILTNSHRRLEKILPIFKAYKRLNTNDLQMTYDKVTNLLMRVITVMQHNEDLLLGHGHGLYGDKSGLQVIIQQYQDIVQRINTLTGKDSKAVLRVKPSGFDSDRVKQYVDDFKNGTLDAEGIEYWQDNIVNDWVREFDILLKDVEKFQKLCEISDEDLKLVNIEGAY